MDLAGNERPDQMGNIGHRKTQSKAISRSLFNLQGTFASLSSFHDLWHVGSALSPWGRLSFVDLAGNERADRTGNTGQRMEESKAINKSLFNLQACLKELRWNQQNAADKEPRNVPYRASKVSHSLYWVSYS